MNLDMNSRSWKLLQASFRYFRLFKLPAYPRIPIHIYFLRTRRPVKRSSNIWSTRRSLIIENEGPGIQFCHEIWRLWNGRWKVVYINESEIFKETHLAEKENTRKKDWFLPSYMWRLCCSRCAWYWDIPGIEQLTIDNVTKDLMVIEYAGDASFIFQWADGFSPNIGTVAIKSKG